MPGPQQRESDSVDSHGLFCGFQYHYSLYSSRLLFWDGVGRPLFCSGSSVAQFSNNNLSSFQIIMLKTKNSFQIIMAGDCCASLGLRLMGSRKVLSLLKDQNSGPLCPGRLIRLLLLLFLASWKRIFFFIWHSFSYFPSQQDCIMSFWAPPELKIIFDILNTSTFYFFPISGRT